MNAIASRSWSAAILVVGLTVVPSTSAAIAQESVPNPQKAPSLSEPTALAAGLEAHNVAVEEPAASAVGSDFETGPRDSVRRYALIVIGIPGDEAHHHKFQKTAGVWQRWLSEIAGVESQNIVLLCSEDENDDTPPATSESVAEVVQQLGKKLTSEDSLWVFLLGHGSQGKRHGWFHLPGADLNSAQWAGLFAPLKAGEQVFWLTQAGSGSFVKPMSLPDRIVIAATDADGEVNETRFPHVLAEVMQRQLDERDGETALDPTPTSVLSLFRAATQQVNQVFDDEQLVPTEHAQLDDNGDGVGTEIAALDPKSKDPPTTQSDPSRSLLDGVRAGRVWINLQPTPESKAALPASLDLPSSPDNSSPGNSSPGNSSPGK